jgi:hypothetical protein
MQHQLGPLRFRPVDRPFRSTLIPGTCAFFEDRMVLVEHDNATTDRTSQYIVPALDVLQEVFYAIKGGDKQPKQHVVFEGYDAALAFETVGDEIIFGDRNYKFIGRQNKTELSDLTVRHMAGEISKAIDEGRMSVEAASNFPIVFSDIPLDEYLFLT